MHVVKSGILASAAICLSVALISGCQIESSTTGSVSDLRYVKISPDLNLRAEPEGYIYELWISTIDPQDDGTFVLGPTGPIVRFKWDPYLYAASDKDDNFLPLTVGSGMELDTAVDVNPYFEWEIVLGSITVEPINDPFPQIPGPSIVALNINPESHTGFLINPYALLTFFGIPPPAASFSLLSQSNKKGVPNAVWRDNATEGYGIWFANPRLEVESTTDAANGWEAYTRTILVPDAVPYPYSVWIHLAHPESSFSNFGLVLANREPDFEFRDGRPVHTAGRFGPSEPIIREGELPIPGVPLGTDPVVIGGEVVGYRYIVGPDTCILRVDDPSLTRCTRDRCPVLIDTCPALADTCLALIDTCQVLRFDKPTPDTLPRVYRVTSGDTSMAPTLLGLLDVSDSSALAAIPFGAGLLFAGWEYEAWLVFTKESNIPPMSMGRFKDPSEADSDNPYTHTDGRFDLNFHFPGEDFLENLSQHHPSLSAPLDVIRDPRVEKIWITLEPDDDFGFDWAPDKPNTQLIYLSAFIPNDLDTSGTAMFPMVHRDLNPGPNSLNEGNFFPTVTVQFNPAPAE